MNAHDGQGEYKKVRLELEDIAENGQNGQNGQNGIEFQRSIDHSHNGVRSIIFLHLVHKKWF